MTNVEQQQRIAERTRVAVQMYEGNESVRAIAGALDVSYGNAHRLLSQAGVTFRSRGGARSPRKTKTA